jgi:hypothetical protein
MNGATGVLLDAIAEAIETPAYPGVSRAWDLYRRTQEIPWPAFGGGEVLKAQSRLRRLTVAHACGQGDGEPDLDAIEAAAADLAAKVRRYCGDAAADYVQGSEEVAS